jgi:hypothetical protein
VSVPLGTPIPGELTVAVNPIPSFGIAGKEFTFPVVSVTLQLPEFECRKLYGLLYGIFVITMTEVVGALVMVTGRITEELPLFELSPLYTAYTVCTPPVRPLLSCSVATPLTTGNRPNWTPSTTNDTTPVGVPVPLDGATVAVNEIASP